MPDRHSGCTRTPRIHVAILSTADWDAPLWTNKQHLAVEMVRLGFTVTYVQSLGLRRPKLNAADAKRGIRRLLGKSHPTGGRAIGPRDLGKDFHLVNPLVIPWHDGGTAISQFNERMLESALEPWRSDHDAYRVLWTFTPVTYNQERHADQLVYHSVDLLHTLPRVDGHVLLNAERRLATVQRMVAAGSSPAIVEHLMHQKMPRIEYWPNVADLSVFPDLRDGALRQGVVFAGNLTQSKIDVALIRNLATAIAPIDIYLIGPIADDGTEIALLGSLPNLHIVPTMSQAELGKALLRYDVGIIPYQLNEYTRGVFPMKVYEYLAAGLPVVSTALPALSGHSEVVTATDAAQFIEQTRSLVGSSSDADRRERRAAAERHSWRTRMAEIEAILREGME